MLVVEVVAGSVVVHVVVESEVVDSIDNVANTDEAKFALYVMPEQT